MFLYLLSAKMNFSMGSGCVNLVSVWAFTVYVSSPKITSFGVICLLSDVSKDARHVLTSQYIFELIWSDTVNRWQTMDGNSFFIHQIIGRPKAVSRENPSPFYCVNTRMRLGGLMESVDISIISWYCNLKFHDFPSLWYHTSPMNIDTIEYKCI